MVHDDDHERRAPVARASAKPRLTSDDPMPMR